jgi:4-aminobutyrate aminotransferase-like enzyme
VAAYHEVRRLNEDEVDALFTLTAARLAMSVCYCAWQGSHVPQNEYLNISNRPAWALLERLAAMPPDWATDVFRRACNGANGGSPAELLAARRKHLGPSLSISYREPLHIIRGGGSYLYDSGGRAYLDCVNNVAHVGHCHPRVVRAATEQMALLNTNTRYLHEHLAEYVERLAATLPEPLSVVYLVCSGSEANELALRLARTHTGRDGVIVVDTAYHGNTNALIDISPYKFNAPGGRGKPPHVSVVPIPWEGRRFEMPARDDVAAFFCESALGCAGQVILPEGYLREAYEAVHAAGGVCVADEVQTGFGRAGSHFWMFEPQGVVPDIVTMGKPIGNGHPMGAVVTTPEIAQSFANGMEYFNTFGGNPVSCAVGLAVLDVIRDEGLQENALHTGNYLLRGLRDLALRRPLIGEVRGQGLFLGFDMVRNRETRDPAAREADELVNRMKQLGVLLSTDGPYHNVIKIKPPMVFSQADANLLLDRLSDALI